MARRPRSGSSRPERSRAASSVATVGRDSAGRDSVGRDSAMAGRAGTAARPHRRAPRRPRPDSGKKAGSAFGAPRFSIQPLWSSYPVVVVVAVLTGTIESVTTVVTGSVVVVW